MPRWAAEIVSGLRAVNRVTLSGFLDVFAWREPGQAGFTRPGRAGPGQGHRPGPAQGAPQRRRSRARAQPNYTVRRAADDWLAQGLHGRSPKTIKKNENVLTPILATIGGMRLRELTADDVHQALAAVAPRYSSAAVAMGHNALTRAIRHAEARDLVRRNVAMLVDTPKGQRDGPARASAWTRRRRSWRPPDRLFKVGTSQRRHARAVGQTLLLESPQLFDQAVLAISLSVDTAAALGEHGSVTLDEHYGRSCQPIAVAGRRCQHQIGRRASRLR